MISNAETAERGVHVKTWEGEVRAANGAEAARFYEERALLGMAEGLAFETRGGRGRFTDLTPDNPPNP